MPDTVQETEFKGHPLIKILTGINSQTGEEYWLQLGIKKAAAVCENIDRIRMFVDKHERKNGTNRT